MLKTPPTFPPAISGPKGPTHKKKPRTPTQPTAPRGNLQLTEFRVSQIKPHFASPFCASPKKAIARSKNRPIEGENHHKPCTQATFQSNNFAPGKHQFRKTTKTNMPVYLG